ncbi:hypothetical protein DXG01_012658 [Tephrocybe rancida]|nr:hypothetical protein DXG01_012658 [Tephrocybe rancida]
MALTRALRDWDHRNFQDDDRRNPRWVLCRSGRASTNVHHVHDLLRDCARVVLRSHHSHRRHCRHGAPRAPRPYRQRGLCVVEGPHMGREVHFEAAKAAYGKLKEKITRTRASQDVKEERELVNTSRSRAHDGKLFLVYLRNLGQSSIGQYDARETFLLLWGNDRTMSGSLASSSSSTVYRLYAWGEPPPPMGSCGPDLETNYIHITTSFINHNHTTTALKSTMSSSTNPATDFSFTPSSPPPALAQTTLPEQGMRPRSPTLRERCGVTFFIHFAPPMLGGQPKGHLQPAAGNLPRRRRAATVPQPAREPPVILDEAKSNSFFSTP